MARINKMTDTLLNFQDILYEIVEKRGQFRSNARDSEKFHISDSGGCYRARYMKRLGIQPTFPIPPGALCKMMAGDAAHDQLQRILKSYDKLLAAETTVGTDDVIGHFDGIVRHDEAKFLLDFKTIEKWGMTHIRKDGPKREHMLQLFTYWYFLRKDYKDLDQASLVYVMREDYQIKQFDWLWSDDVAAEMSREWSPLLAYWDRKELPPCTCTELYNGTGPKYCRFKTDEIGSSCCDELLINKKL
jgi:hypothetical protein